MSSFFKKNSIVRRDETDTSPALRGRAAPMPSPFVNEQPMTPAEPPPRALGNPFSKPAPMAREEPISPMRRPGEYAIPCPECGRSLPVRDKQAPRIPDVPPHLVDQHVFMAGRATCDCGVIIQMVAGKVVTD